MPVEEACEKLGISRQRFYILEDRAVAEYLRALAPRPAGRPAKPIDPALPLKKQIEMLEKENRKLGLYIKVLRKLAGIEDGGKKGGRRSKTAQRGGEADGR
jgi:hypothetical protein